MVIRDDGIAEGGHDIGMVPGELSRAPENPLGSSLGIFSQLCVDRPNGPGRINLEFCAELFVIDSWTG